MGAAKKLLDFVASSSRVDYSSLRGCALQVRQQSNSCAQLSSLKVTLDSFPLMCSRAMFVKRGQAAGQRLYIPVMLWGSVADG